MANTIYQSRNQTSKDIDCNPWLQLTYTHCYQDPRPGGHGHQVALFVYHFMACDQVGANPFYLYFYSKICEFSWILITLLLYKSSYLKSYCSELHFLILAYIWLKLLLWPGFQTTELENLASQLYLTKKCHWMCKDQTNHD